MSMDATRAGEIALKLIKLRVKTTGLQFKELKRELGRIAKEADVPQADLHEFLLLHVLPGLISDAFGDAVATIQVRPDNKG
jgi:hypothetical protein